MKSKRSWQEAAADKAGTSPLAQQTAPVNERPVPDTPPTITQNNSPELSVPATARAPEAPTVGTQRNQVLITLKPNEGIVPVNSHCALTGDMAEDAQPA